MNGWGALRRPVGWHLAFALIVAACATSASPSPTSVPTPSLAPPTATIPAPPPPSGSGAPALSVDPALLAVLPATVAGLSITESTDAETASLADPELARIATSFAAGLAVDTGAGSFIFAVVIRLKSAGFDTGTFRDYRDSFDLGACSQSNGVTGNAEAQIGGRTVYIGTCAGGLRTYHVWLAEPGLLISASAIGDRRLGELLVQGLRP